MDFNGPAGKTIADKKDVIGKATPRIDGRLKTSGTAAYAYERHDVVRSPLYGYPLCAAIPKGRIRSMDTRAASAAPGVTAVIAANEMEVLPKAQRNVAHLFGGSVVEHYHQAIAIVVADSFETARAAAALIRVEYERDETAGFDIHAAHASLITQETEPVSRTGDFEKAFEAAPVTLDQTYTTPAQSHAMMEPHATTAQWDGDKLTLWTSSQMIAWTRASVAGAFNLPQENVRIDSPYIGGGFGAKLYVRADAAMAALAARKTGRAVKLALPRPVIANNTTHRAATIQRIRVGAERDGRITAIAHEGTSNTLPGGRGENSVEQTRIFYAGANRLIIRRLAQMHLPESNAMRAPGEASGLMALEIAMDELAEKLGIDPVDLRIINDTQIDPEAPSRPFSERRFIECLRTGAERFGWAERNRTPGQRREGAWLIGHGVAGGYRGSPAMASGARLRLQPSGVLIVETDMTDIGTGSYTIIAQTAAEVLGLPIEVIDVRLGDTNFPASAGSGGQWGAASATAGVYAACMAFRAEAARRLGLTPDSLVFERGAIRSGEEVFVLADLARDGEIVIEDSITFGSFRNDVEVATFVAHFVEVGVHAATGEIRVRRMLAACDAGRILNPLTARSQVIGGMVMGIGAAIMEELAVDTNKGFFANHDLAGYEVPVHADIPEQEVIFIGDADPYSTPLKAKGVGELGLCGVAAAVANGIYNATAIRVRDYPVTLDKLLSGLPAV